MRDIGQALSSTPSILPAAARTNGTVNGVNSLDLGGFDGAVVVVHTGVITDGSHAITVQESDTGTSGFADVAAADLVDDDNDGAKLPAAITTGAGGSKTFEIGYVGKKRYIRAVITTSGATSGGFIDVVVVRGPARKSPA
jgi:hypothetical protein